MGTITQTVTLIPSGYEDLSNMSTSTSYPIDRGYNDTSNSSFARFNVTQSSTGNIYYTFDTSSIPAGATITSVTAKARAYVGNTSRVTATFCQLYSGSTARGTNATFGVTQSANITTLNTGTGWTRAYLNDLRIRIGGTASSSSSSRYVYFAGAEVNITYTVTSYTVTATGDGTLDPASAELVSGDSYTLTISGLNSRPTVTDNGVDVSSQLVESTEETDVAIPNGSTVSTYTDADSTTYADLQLAGSSTGTVYLDMSDIDIPFGATIVSVSCRVTLQFNNNSSTSGFTSSCQMYANNTAKGSSTQWVSSGSAVAKNTYTLTVGSWTATEINNARFYLTATNSARSTARHVYIYGVSFSVTYESDGVWYIYTINSVTGDHTIVVSAGASTQTIYYKVNGSWVAATAVYKKVSGSWVLQTNLANVFSAGTNYRKG